MTDNCYMTDANHSVDSLKPAESNPYPLAKPVQLRPLSPYIRTHAEYKDMLGAAGLALVLGSTSFLGVLVATFSVVALAGILHALAGKDPFPVAEQYGLFWVFGIFASLAVASFIIGTVLSIIGWCKRIDKSGAKVSRVMSKITVIIAGFIIVIAAVIVSDFFAV